MENNENIAKSLTISDTHPRIEAWMTEHDAFSCSPILLFTNSDPLESDIGTGIGACEPGENKCEWYVNQECYYFNHLVHQMVIEEIKLEKFESEWLVVDWSEVHETRNSVWNSWK
jgi:hypothetical protein